VKVGDKLRVEIADIDARGKISLVPVKDDEPAAEQATDAAASGADKAPETGAEKGAESHSDKGSSRR
jgi:polyribonucleotide nucleotidyltransferase